MTLNASLFSTTLKQVTGIFERHGLVSAFFPNLIFWGVTLCLVAGEVLGWASLLKQWEAVPVTVQVLSLIAFLAWTAFCTFLTINFQSTLIRLYEGYWPIPDYILAYSFLGRFGQHRKRHYQRQWAKFKAQDNELEQQQIALFLQQRQLSQPMEDLNGDFSSLPAPVDFETAKEAHLATMQAITPAPTNAIALAANPPAACVQTAAQLQQQRVLPNFW